MLDSEKVFQEINKKFSALNLPIPPKPNVEEGELQIPDDPSKMPIAELATKMMRFASLFGYSTYLLGVLESKLELVDAEYKLRINSASLPVRKELGRQSADVIEAAVLAENQDLSPLFVKRAELLSNKKLLTARIAIYDKFYAALSREQSRREAEMRIQ